VLPCAMARSVVTAAAADSAQINAPEASVGSSAIAILVPATVAVVNVLPVAATTNVGNIARGTGVHMGAPELGVRRVAWVMSAAVGAVAKTVQLVVLALTALGTALAQIAITMPKTSVSPHRQPLDRAYQTWPRLVDAAAQLMRKRLAWRMSTELACLMGLLLSAIQKVQLWEPFAAQQVSAPLLPLVLRSSTSVATTSPGGIAGPQCCSLHLCTLSTAPRPLGARG